MFPIFSCNWASRNVHALNQNETQTWSQVELGYTLPVGCITLTYSRDFWHMHLTVHINCERPVSRSSSVAKATNSHWRARKFVPCQSEYSSYLRPCLAGLMLHTKRCTTLEIYVWRTIFLVVLVKQLKTDFFSSLLPLQFKSYKLLQSRTGNPPPPPWLCFHVRALFVSQAKFPFESF